ncbi:MAG TPA: hypothetical protein VHC69_15780 [Polyangiaceae bacterium]|nr:hypothetical protein [Polyangiaceae bacterium]
MTTAAVTLPGALDAPRASRRSRAGEFLLVGGITPFLFPLAALARRAVGADSAELAIGFLAFHAAHVINDPHFSVTYLLFYKDFRKRLDAGYWGRAQQVRYVVAGFVAPLVLVAWAAGALVARSAVGLGWLIQLMFLLVGWHYVRQGFGVLSILSARHGARLGDGERRVYSAHAFAAWAYAWASPADPGTEMEERGVVYTSLAHGTLLEHVTLAVFVASAVAVAIVVVRRRVTTGRFPPLAPLFGYLAALWSWTVYSRIEPLVVYVIPALHSVQYLYFVWLLKSAEERTLEERPFVSRSVATRFVMVMASAVALAWFLFHGVPEVLDAAFFPRRGHFVDPGNLGAAPCVAAFFVCVNIHHYFMDYVIWRRENPEARRLPLAPSAKPG